MPRAAFVISQGSSHPLREFVTAVQHELERQGVPCRTYPSFPPPDPGQVYVLVAPREFLAVEGEHGLPEQALLDRTVCLTAERPEQLTGPADVALLDRAGAVFDIGQRAVVRLHQLDVSARLLRPGYSEPLDHYSDDGPRPIDVMFLGADTPRRRALLGELAPVLARRDCVLQIAEDPLPPGETSMFLAESRWSRLARTKVLVNLHRGDPAPMAWLRMMDAFHSGAVLLSEPASQTLPFVAGEHFIVARAEAMGLVLDGLLDDAGRLAAVRAAAYERLHDWLPLAASVSVLRAALVELVGQPLPASPRLGRVGELSGPRDDDDAREVTLERELQHARRELAEVRAGLTSLREAVTAPAFSRRPRIIERTGAWAARRRPAVSLLVALAGPDRDVAAVLDSLSGGGPIDRELVIVGAPASPAVAAARRWMRERPRVSACLISAPTQVGLGGQLGIALDHARADACLVLGPGEGLFARGLDALTTALNGDDELAFVHPIRVRRRPEAPVTPAGSAVIESGSCAPVLARVRALRAIRGIAAGPIAGGALDETLAARLTAGGFAGRQVPQILAWRSGAGEISERRADRIA